MKSKSRAKKMTAYKSTSCANTEDGNTVKIPTPPRAGAAVNRFPALYPRKKKAQPKLRESGGKRVVAVPS